jgi:hypothetical protein
MHMRNIAVCHLNVYEIVSGLHFQAALCRAYARCLAQGGWQEPEKH